MNYGAPHMTIYGAQVDRKWAESWPEVGQKLAGSGTEVKCWGSTSALRFLISSEIYHLTTINQNKVDF